MAEIGSLDHILSDYVGGCGRYQLFNTLLMTWVYQTSAVTLLLHVFTAYEPPHRCLIPECEVYNETKVIIAIYIPLV